jgi:hypothetical protein
VPGVYFLRAGGRGHCHQGGRVGHIVKLSRQKHYPRKHGSDCHGVLIWVKLSFGFDMGQIVIFFLLPAFFFLRGKFPAAGAKNMGHLGHIVTPNKSLACNIGGANLYIYTFS